MKKSIILFFAFFCFYANVESFNHHSANSGSISERICLSNTDDSKPINLDENDVILSVLESNVYELLIEQKLNQSGVLVYSGKELFYEIVESNDACSIIKYRYEGKIWYNVIAWIVTDLLPDAVYEICVRTFGDVKVCDAVYAATKVLIELRGDKVEEGIIRGIKWFVSKGSYKSSAKISTGDYSIASAAKTVFEAYRQECSNGGSVPWESISVNRGESGSYQKTKIYNSKSSKVHVDYSVGASTWMCIDFNAYASFTFADNVKYIKVFTGNDDYESYDISQGKSYKIVWCSEHGQNELRE